MKDLITTIASILIFTIFLSQFAANLTVHNRLIQADRAIEAFRDRMKEEGYMSERNRIELEEALRDICNCDRSDVRVSGTGIPSERGEILRYRISFPVKDLIGAVVLLGIDPEKNQADFYEEGCVVSRFQSEKEESGEEETESE